MQKCIKIALCGEPNVGKSTLINQIIGERISIVSPKVQTTRALTRGIINEGNSQLIFIDTPGLFKADGVLEKHIVRNAISGVDECDIVCWLVDAKKPLNMSVLKILKKKEIILVVNKVDLLRKDILLHSIHSMSQMHDFKSIFMISALKNDGVKDMISYLSDIAPLNDWLYSEDEYTDATIRNLAEEFVREQLFLLLNRELPYSLKVETEKWEEMKNGDLKIYHAITVLRKSHKQIVLGEKGSKIKEIGTRARNVLSKMFKRKVHLYLHIKVKEDWIDRELV